MAAAPRRSESVELLIAAFLERIEREVDDRARTIASGWMEALAAGRAPTRRRGGASGRAPAQAPAPGSEHLVASEVAAPAFPEDQPDHGLREVPAPPKERRPPRRRAARVVAPPPPPDPEQQRRDAELARLRQVLRPVDVEASVAAPAPVESRTDPPRDPLKLLEEQIRDQFPAFAKLAPPAATARLAAWAGRARLCEEESGNRVAVGLLLEKLRALASSMELGRIDALVPSWRTRNWRAYVAENEALAEAPAAQRVEPAAANDTGDESGYAETWST